LLGLKEDYKVMLVMAVLALVMVYAFGSQGGNSERTIFISDLERSSFSEQFIEELEKLSAYKVVPTTEQDGRNSIRNNDGLALIIIPQDFTSEMTDGDVSLKFISSKNDVDTLNVKTATTNILSRLSINHEFAEQTAGVIGAMNKAVDTNSLENAIYDKVESRYKFQNPYSVKVSSIKGGWNDETAVLYRFFGFALLFSAYSIVFGVGEILNDKAYHTWDRLLSSPVSTSAILFGNTLTTVFTGMIQMAVIFIGGSLLFKIDFGGNMLIILTVCTAYIFSLTGLGLLLVSFLKNHGQLSAITPILLTSFAMLGGCMWPLEIVTSKILLALSLITPHRWALEALGNVTIKGLSFSSSFLEIGILLGMGLTYTLVGGIVIARGNRG